MGFPTTHPPCALSIVDSLAFAQDFHWVLVRIIGRNHQIDIELDVDDRRGESHVDSTRASWVNRCAVVGLPVVPGIDTLKFYGTDRERPCARIGDGDRL